MANSRKKVIVRLLDGGMHAGYLPAAGLLDETGAVALLDLEARALTVPLDGVRHIAYVRDFNLGEAEPERLSRRVFLARPRTEGVWLRLTMVGGEVLEGLAAADLGLVDGLLEDGGVYLTPPDVRSNTQRIFVPRTAIAGLVVVGVIGAPAVKMAQAVARQQESLFGGQESTNAEKTDTTD